MKIWDVIERDITHSLVVFEIDNCKPEIQLWPNVWDLLLFSKFNCDRINSISFVDFYDDSIEKGL